METELRINAKYPIVLSLIIFILALGFVITAASHSHAKEAEIKYNIPHTRSKPVIDGDVKEGEWDSAERVSLDFEVYPSENIPASAETVALMMEDGDNFYVAFIASDPEPEKIRAFFRDRDASYDDDFVAVVIDTFNDEKRAYEFLVNPLGVQMDLIFDDVIDNEDDSWNAIWDSAGKINGEGYVVEMKIPLNQLRFPEGLDKQVWGIDLVRRYPRDKRTKFSSNPKDYNLSCQLCQYSKAQGFSQLKRNVNLRIVPAVTASYYELRPEPGTDGWESDSKIDGGLDIRWGINQDFYLNATLNPDFSQVEADVAEIDVNNTFSLFYPERREFFLEGADYFNTHTDLIYTRNVSSPEYGIKLTGKRGKHTNGLFFANDETTGFIIPGIQGSRIASLENTESLNTAYRYRFDINPKMDLGMIVTDRRADGYSNTVTGTDGNIRMGGSDTIEMLFMKSFSEYPDSIQADFDQKPELDDWAYLINYEHNSRSWYWKTAYSEYGEDFRADMGFITRVGYRQINAAGGHTWRFGSGSKFNRIYAGAEWDRKYDESGKKLEETSQLSVNADGPMQAYLDLALVRKECLYNSEYFDEYYVSFYGSIKPMAGMVIQLEAELGDCIDYMNTRLGKMLSLGPALSMQAGKHFLIDWIYNYQKLEIDGSRLYVANLSDLRLTYQFGLRSFLRATVQYSDINRSPSLYVSPVDGRSKDLTTQLLYSYKINPQTRFFIGYSDSGFQDDDQDEITRTNWSVFTKLSYAWQY